MLTTSTISMSMGSDSANARQVSPDRTDTPTISFAESFDKGVPALGSEMPLKPDSSKEVKPECEAEHIVSSIKLGGVDSTSIKMKADASGEVKIQEKYKNTSNSMISKNATMATAIPGAMISSNHKSHEDILMAVGTATTNNQRVAEKLKDVEQKLTPEIVDSVILESDNQAEAAKIKVAPSMVPATLDNGVTVAVQNKKEILTLNKNENTIPGKKIAKDRDGIMRTDKLSKIEEKAIKIEEPVGKEVEAGQIANIPNSTIRIDIPHDSNIGRDNLLSSLDFAAPKQSVDMNSVLVRKLDDKTHGTGKIDDDSTKSTTSLADDSSLQKVGTDVSKASLFAASMIDGDSAKAQNTVTAGEATGMAHAQPGMVVAAAGGASEIVIAQIVAPKPLAPEVNSHPTNAHADSVVDASGTIEAVHQTLMATPTSLEVGVANGTHGWLKIRAEMTVGGVNASLSPATSSGQEMLHRELSSLTAYLQSERVLVNAVVVQPTVVPTANFQQFAGGINDGGRGQTPQSDGQGGQQNRQDAASTVTHHLERDGTYRDAGEDKLLPLVSYAGGGRWLNVRA